MSHAATTLDLLDRSREAITGGYAASAASARYLAASLAALRAAAALVAAGSATGRVDVRMLTDYVARGLTVDGLHTQVLALTVVEDSAARLRIRGRAAGPHDVWSLTSRVAPELTEWSERFAAVTGQRIGVETGLVRVTAREADDLLRDAETFVDLAAARLGLPSAHRPRRLAPVRTG